MKKICLHPTDMQTRRPKGIFYFSLFLFIFFNWLRITRSCLHKYQLTGHFKSFTKMRLHPTNIQSRRQIKNYIDFFLFFLLYFNRLNITRSGRQKYQLTGNFKSFKKMRFYPTDMQTRQQKIKFRFFHFFFIFFYRLNITRSGRQ